MTLTAQLVHTALADLLPQRSGLETSQVLEVVASVFGISTEALCGRRPLTRDRPAPPGGHVPDARRSQRLAAADRRSAWADATTPR